MVAVSLVIRHPSQVPASMHPSKPPTHLPIVPQGLSSTPLLCCPSQLPSPPTPITTWHLGGLSPCAGSLPGLLTETQCQTNNWRLPWIPRNACPTAHPPALCPLRYHHLPYLISPLLNKPLAFLTKKHISLVQITLLTLCQWPFLPSRLSGRYRVLDCDCKCTATAPAIA